MPADSNQTGGGMDPVSIVSLVLQVISETDRVMEAFKSIKNAPSELQDFRRAVKRLERNLDDITKQDAALLSLHRDDQAEIMDTLGACSSFLRDGQRAMKGPMRRIVWSLQSKTKVAEYRKELEDKYSTIIAPVWLKTVNAQLGAQVRPTGADVDTSSRDTTAALPLETGVVRDDATLLQARLRRVDRMIESLRDNPSPDVTAQIVSELDRCRAEIKGGPTGSTPDPTGPGMPNQDPSRRESTPYEPLRTILSLESDEVEVLEGHRRLKLHQVRIMAKDDGSRERILEFQSLDESIQVTHIVPYGTIPLTPHHKSSRVSFLSEHFVKVVERGDECLYRIAPQYRFDDASHCRRFQSLLRDRELLGIFKPLDISEPERHVVVAREQVVRLWRRNAVVTMTYLQSSIPDHCTHANVDLAWFKPDCAYWRSTLGIRRSHEDQATRALDIVSVKELVNSLRITFNTPDDAKEFRDAFRNAHPSRRGGPASSPNTAVAQSPALSSRTNSPALTAGSASSRAGSGSGFSVMPPPEWAQHTGAVSRPIPVPSSNPFFARNGSIESTSYGSTFARSSTSRSGEFSLRECGRGSEDDEDDDDRDGIMRAVMDVMRDKDEG